MPAASQAIVPKKASSPDLRNFTDLEGLIAAVGGEVADDEASGEAEARGLLDQVKALPPGEHESLWRRVLTMAGEYLSNEKLLPGGGSEVDELADRALHAVAALMASFAEGALDASRSAVLPQAFVEVATLCQEMLLTIPNGQTQALIARALERICTDLFEGREDFFGGVLMFLIGKCLEPRAKAADVTRLYKVRDLLGELDWEHESIDALKMQLMRCAASPTFVRSQHGPDMLCLFYTIYPGFTAEVHGTVKEQVMYTRPTVLESYASGLFKAWRASEGGTRVQIEHCVQEWAGLAIRSARKSADKARAMLEDFHRHRHADEHVNELLCRLYGPLLWRCLKVANWQVRENAARLLQYTFALFPKELNVADREQELNRQLRLLREALEDPSEPVRRVGCSAVCIILKTYWDIMPPGDTAELLSILTNKCAQDKKAPMVRAAVAEGFSWILLDNPKSHPAMETMLPRVADLMNDRSPIVRAAFVCLLNSIQRCKGFSLSKIISNEALFMRLASEHTEAQAERLQKGTQSSKKISSDDDAEAKASPDLVAKRLARLIAPSIFQSDITEQVRRCTYMLTSHPLTLLALLSHAKDIIATHNRVKLAAALFHMGLRDATGSGTGGSPAQRHKKVSMLLRVVGVLLEGASEPSKRARKKGTTATGRFPKELESFVYEHIKEDAFMPLLRASDEEDTAAARVRDDLLLAISSLDPAKLPNTAEMVRHELTMACRGAGDAAGYALPRLTALMHTAMKWGILGSALEPAWERLLAAATRLKERQAAAEDTANAITVVEAVFRDQDVRSSIMPAQAETLKQIVEGIFSAFSKSWTAGLANLRSSAATPEPTLMGPAAKLWPRILGLVMRVALHLEHRLVPSRAADGSEAAPTDPNDSNGEVGAAVPPSTSLPPSPPSLPETMLVHLGQAISSNEAMGVLEALETVVAAKSGESLQPAKKRAKGVAMPADADMVLLVHERLLEAINATHFLSPLKRNATSTKDGTVTPVLARDVELCLWRWACIADVLQPLAEGPRLTPTWVVLGRLLHQMAFADIPTPHVIEALVRLLCRVTEEVPGDDAELKKPLQAIFQRMEFEPQLVKTLAAMIASAEPAATGADAADEAKPEPIEVHARVRKVIMELCCSFRNLRAKLLPPEAEAEQAPQSPGQDRRRILASPTPQKAARGQEFLTMSLADLDGEAMLRSASRLSESRLSLGQRSFSVRSRSPPPPMPDDLESLRHSYVADPEAASLVSEVGDPASPMRVDLD
mmetsp:Transcript_91241/g.221553  ORF Transcript_91241/g.221553 Transcript_91241/m.221553 type:complete len:1257 (-) Transcript_91241:468-4238(-)